jgi:hypothetical protein
VTLHGSEQKRVVQTKSPNLPLAGPLRRWQGRATTRPDEPRICHWTWDTTAEENGRYPTCFKRRSPIPDVPLPSLRKRINPTRTMESKTTSVTRRTMMLSLLVSDLVTTHSLSMGSQKERSCRWNEYKRFKVLGTDYSLVRHLRNIASV